MLILLLGDHGSLAFEKDVDAAAELVLVHCIFAFLLAEHLLAQREVMLLWRLLSKVTRQVLGQQV